MKHFRYAVTDRAWRSMKDMNTDQCLIFTGESGSGKTEAMKLSLQYLAAITGHPREFHLTKFQILQSNIVLESFGNAKTRANDNSSRFGKFMEVSFDFKGDPTGAHITNCKSTTLYVFWRSLTILSTFASFRCRFAWKGKCGCSEEETQEEIRLLLNRMYTTHAYFNFVAVSCNSTISKGGTQLSYFLPTPRWRGYSVAQ